MPRFAHATTSLVIIDPLQKITEPSSAPVARARHESFEVSVDGPAVSVKLTDAFDATAHAEICLNKYTLVSVIGTLSVLIIVQTTVVLTFIFKRIARNRTIVAAKLVA